MKVGEKKIAFGLTSAFYMFKSTISEIKKLIAEGGEVFPILSFSACVTDSKFGKGKDFMAEIEAITEKKIINTMQEAEEIDTDIMVIAPCSRE